MYNETIGHWSAKDGRPIPTPRVVGNTPLQPSTRPNRPRQIAIVVATAIVLSFWLLVVYYSTSKVIHVIANH